MASQHRGLAFAAIGAGALFAWSGLTNRKITSSLQSIIQGEKPAKGGGPTPSNETTNASAINQATGNTGVESNTAAHNQQIAKMLATPLGWSGGQQWTCLVELWNQESGWSNTAENPSGAYGVAQALPNTKYPKAGQPPSEGGSANATVQIAWGLAYIAATYGTPCGAWQHEVDNGWY